MQRTLWRATAVVLLFIACNKPAPKPPRQTAGAGPQVRATVVTIRTTLQPANRNITHTVVIGESMARSTDEADTWRLYDLRQNRVTFVDDIERTIRTLSLESLIAARRAQLRRPSDREVPRAEYEATDQQRQILQVDARQSVIRLGGYTRELWFAEHPAIPNHLFAMMHASDPPSTRLAAIISGPDDALLAVRAFPLAERAELPYGNQKMVVDRLVTAIEQKNVPASMLEVPKDYKDLTKAPAASRPPASSRPAGPGAPATGSQSSATDQRTP